MSPDAHEKINRRFVEAQLNEGRFINVKDGGKASHDHDTRWSDPREVRGTNYGIYADKDAALVILDVDDHDGGGDEADDRGLSAIASLPPTLRAESPHKGEHRFYKVSGLGDGETAADVFKEELGVANPVPTWGEVIAKNKYTVGPGSVLDGCSKEWCESCEAADGGGYTLLDDRSIEPVPIGELVEALEADPDVGDASNESQASLEEINAAVGGEGGDSPGRSESDSLTRESVEDALAHIDPDCGYNQWRNVGFALQANFDSREVAKKVFKKWSQGGYSDQYDAPPASWDSEAATKADQIVDDADTPGDDGRGVDVGTLIHLATNDDEFGAWTLPSSEAPDPPEPSDAPGWAEVRALYDHAENTREGRKGTARLAAARALEEETSWMYVLESERLWVYEEETGTFGKYGEAEAGRMLAEELRDYFSLSEKREIVGRLRQMNQTRRDELNARSYSDPLVCVGNGVVNLKTGELHDHSPEYAFVRGLQWDYPTDGVASDRDRVLEFLDGVTMREADRDTLLDHLGHGLMPGHPYRAFVVCYGPGGNGKTQVAEVFRGFVGEENAASVEIDELASDDFSTGDLPGKFVNWGDDMAGDGGGALTDLSLLKKASGGSHIRANEKFEKTFDFKNEAALFFSANEPPRIGEQKRSIGDRIYPIEMPYTFESDPDPSDPMQKEKTPNISQELLDDDAAMRGLLELAVEHAQRLIETRGEYSQPETREERLAKYNNSADPIIRFSNTAVAEASAEYKIRKDDLYRLYQALTESWAERTASERGFKRQFKGALSFEVESAQSRALASADDESDRVQCLKRVKWTPEARSTMPEWMVERYAGHFDSEETEAVEETPEETADLADLDPGEHGVITATVGGFLKPPDWLAAEGWLTDGGDFNLDFEVREALDGSHPFSDVNEGDTVRIHGAAVKTKDDVRYVEITPKCDVEIVDDEGEPSDSDGTPTPEQAAADGGEPKAVPPEEPPDSESDESDACAESPPADAEGARTEPNRKQRACAYVAERGTVKRGAVVGHLKHEHGLSEAAAKETVSGAIEQGGLIEDGSEVRYNG